MLGLEDAMAALPENATLCAFEEHMGRELGVVRMSLGLASDFRDIYKVIQFASLIGKEEERQKLWHDWQAEKANDPVCKRNAPEVFA